MKNILFTSPFIDVDQLKRIIKEAIVELQTENKVSDADLEHARKIMEQWAPHECSTCHFERDCPLRVHKGIQRCNPSYWRFKV